MKRNGRNLVGLLVVSLSTLLFFTGITRADLFHHVSIDISSLKGNALELEIDLFENSGVVGDSWTVIDNMVLGGAVINFEDAILQGFDNSLNPGNVSNGTKLSKVKYILLF